VKRAVLALLLGAGCSGNHSAAAPDAAPAVASCGAPADRCWVAGRIASVRGCSDRHCAAGDGGLLRVPTDYSTCRIAPEMVLTSVPPDESDATLGTPIEADDDGCGFHVRMVPHCTGTDRALALDIQLSSAVTGNLVTRAAPYVDAFSSPTHISPNAGTTTELAPGHYRIEPVVFDQPGVWTLAVHFFGTCPDMPHAPHGHTSLTVDVP
jgi:hypothetical protein